MGRLGVLVLCAAATWGLLAVAPGEARAEGSDDNQAELAPATDATGEAEEAEEAKEDGGSDVAPGAADPPSGEAERAGAAEAETAERGTDTDAADTDPADSDAADTDAADTDAADTDAADTDAADTDSADTDAADTETADSDAEGSATDDSAGPDGMAGSQVVFSVIVVSSDNRVVMVDGGYYQGIIERMRFRITRGTQEVAVVEAFWAMEDRTSAHVVPGTKRVPIEVGDTAQLIPELPDLRRPTGGTHAAPRSQPAADEVAEVDDDTDEDAVASNELRRLVGELQEQVFQLHHRTHELELERDEARGQQIVLEYELGLASEAGEELRRQLGTTLGGLQRDISFGLGGRAGATFGTPMFGAFGLGLERFGFEARAAVDVFAPGPIHGFRLGVVLQEQPGRGPSGLRTTLRTSVFTDIYFPDPFGGLHTGLVFRYAHHHFPETFRGLHDSGELSISWGKRIPMTQQREAESFWSYEFRPLVEIVHAPYGATGTDLRLGVGFPDLVEVWVNFNWHYFTDYGRFGALLVRARVPVVQDHGHLGSIKLILAGDYTYPFNSRVYDHTYSVGLHLQATLGR